MNLNTYQIIITIHAPDRELPSKLRNELQAAMDSLPKDMREAVTVGSVMDESLEPPSWRDALAQAVDEQIADTRNFEEPNREIKLISLYVLERVLNLVKQT